MQEDQGREDWRKRKKSSNRTNQKRRRIAVGEEEEDGGFSCSSGCPGVWRCTLTEGNRGGVGRVRGAVEG